jgi:hypothetical protein
MLFFHIVDQNNTLSLLMYHSEMLLSIALVNMYMQRLEKTLKLKGHFTASLRNVLCSVF